MPANLLLLRFGARRWIGRIMVTWGLLAACMMLVRKPWEFYSIRLLLGAAEAGFFPGVVYYLTLWFPQRIRARAISNFYVAIPLSVIFMASASGYLLDLNGRWGLTGWQWMFLVEAVPAVLLGVVVFAVLPNGPNDARWLSEDERTFVAEQLAIESEAAADARRHTLREMLRDSRIWLIAAFMFANFVASYAYNLTAPLIIQEITGFNNKTIGFIAAAISVVGVVAILTNGRLASSRSSIYACIIFSGWLIALGCLGVGLFHSPFLIILSLALIPSFHNAMFPPVYALAASFLAQRGAAGGLALINSVGIIGGFIGPYYLGLAKDYLGSYQRGFLTISLLCFAGTAVMVRVRGRAAS